MNIFMFFVYKTMINALPTVVIKIHKILYSLLIYAQSLLEFLVFSLKSNCHIYISSFTLADVLQISLLVVTRIGQDQYKGQWPENSQNSYSFGVV